MDFASLVGKTVKIVGVNGLDVGDELAYTLTFEIQNDDGEKTYVEVGSVLIDCGNSSALTCRSREHLYRLWR